VLFFLRSFWCICWDTRLLLLSAVLRCHVDLRLKERCAKCPNTAWLLFLMFSLALLALVAVSVYLSKKRLNLAALGIGLVRAVSHIFRVRNHGLRSCGNKLHNAAQPAVTFL
jgi:hypothetical protein